MCVQNWKNLNVTILSLLCDSERYFKSLEMKDLLKYKWLKASINLFFILFPVLPFNTLFQVHF